ncbi:hypothetical protein L596_026796 [Steinernema carpocapsae]|uniref:Uncharacterized protein n=1 Tax=Steinernema carpocapsae TaxID=34508 RepID=A0A4U5M2E1_STECR|nr:hypothetical protein L596_026796 [Steinernema carpocapsae]
MCTFGRAILLLFIVREAQALAFGLDGFALSRHLNKMFGKKSSDELAVPPPTRRPLDMSLMMMQPAIINMNPSLQMPDQEFELIESPEAKMPKTMPKINPRTRLWLFRK